MKSAVEMSSSPRQQLSIALFGTAGGHGEHRPSFPRKELRAEEDFARFHTGIPVSVDID
jgi:hypothetical protein